MISQWKEKPTRDKAYLDFIRNQPCLVCGRKSEAHHSKTGGMSTKGSDYDAVPLCGPFGHHAELHNIGKKTFESKYLLDFQAQIERLQRIFKAKIKELK